MSTLKATIILNGVKQTIIGAGTLLELINLKKLNKETIVVEKNLKIIPKEELEKERIAENDSIEIISFVGGG
jgi:thiamine biosynthesis protein ThiS